MRSLATTAATVTAVVLAAALTACSGGSAGTATTVAATSSAPSPASSATSPAPSPSDALPDVATPAAGLVPLWPFTTATQAAEWQKAYRAGGTQPWHLDPEQTALAFTRDHLGYREVDRVTSRTVRGGDARLGVGWNDPETRESTVAVLHLIRLGSGADAPWVVVGTDDTRLTLDTPRYGATAGSPVTVGGLITGVDESLRVVVLGPTSSRPLGTVPGIPAGGERTRWSTSVRFTAPAGTVLTVAVSTGGHLKDVEAFAITALRST
jgi:hypothetical protein